MAKQKKRGKDSSAQGKELGKESERGKIDFLGKAPLFAVVSSVFTLAALAVILVKGLSYGIDFAGGTEVQVRFAEPVSIEDVRGFAAQNSLKHATVQSFGEGNEFLLRFDASVGDSVPEQKAGAGGAEDSFIKSVVTGLKESFSGKKPEIRRVDSVGPQVGNEMKRNGLLAVFYSLLMILIYVGLRFDYKYAPGAVICLFHDAVITIGILALIGMQINVQILAAVLTIIGYSLNDTIVNFDRMRENEQVYRDRQLPFVVNRSLNDVLSRTLLTSITTLIAVTCLYLLAGGVIQDFALTLGIGIVIGTYSSIYVASPILVLTDRLQGNQS